MRNTHAVFLVFLSALLASASARADIACAASSDQWVVAEPLPVADVQRMLGDSRLALRSERGLRLSMRALVAGVIGARLYHVIDYWQRYYQYNPGKIPAVWEGGLGIWGAIVGAVLGRSLYSYFKKKNLRTILEAFAVGAPIAQAIGRLGNWVNGELYGKNGEPLFACEAFPQLLPWFC